jgi:hypothetical protein
LTIDSRVTDSAPPRVIQGKVVEDLEAFHSERRASKKGDKRRSVASEL